MSAMTLSKTGKRYTHEEWMKLVQTGEATQLIEKYGPAYTDEAWNRHFGTKTLVTRKSKWK